MGGILREGLPRQTWGMCAESNRLYMESEAAYVDDDDGNGGK